MSETKTKVHHGDCLTVLPSIETASIDLIYLDPPFFTGKKHTLSNRDRNRRFSFNDTWLSSDEYGVFLYDRLCELYRTLAPHGSIFFHCNRDSAHIARIVLDEVFSGDSFRSEIIWHYRRWSNAKTALLPTHQTIYYYTKSDDFTFNSIWEEYSPSTNVDQILQRRARDQYNKVVYERDLFGNIINDGRKKGVPLSDVWDIPFLNPKAKERTGYPTQKPLLLLERIIELASNEGDIVLDPFCGSGTTLVAAKLLGRHAIGIDIANDAVELSVERLNDPIKSKSNLMQQGREAYRSADRAAHSYLRGLDYFPVHRNSGIDAFVKHKIDGNPVPVRVQREGETPLEAAIKLHKAAEGKGARTMFLVVTNTGGYMSLGDDLPQGVVVVEAPASKIRKHLTAIFDTRHST